MAAKITFIFLPIKEFVRPAKKNYSSDSLFCSMLILSESDKNFRHTKIRKLK